jgi:HlyD family secretion protein
MKKKLLYTGIAIVVIAVGAFLFVRYQAAKKVSASTFQTLVVEKGGLTGTVGATGTVRANQSSWLVWQTSGTVSNVNYNLGDIVKSGDVLALLNKTTLSQNIIMAEADLVSAQKTLDDLKTSKLAAANAELALVNAQKDYEDRLQERETLNSPVNYQYLKMTALGPRIRKGTRSANEREINEADAKLAVATAKMEDAQKEWDRLKNGPDPRDIAAAEARVAAAQATIDLEYISAPFSGTITDIPVKVGDVVSIGSQAFRVDDLSHLLVDVDVSEIDINRVKLGQDVTLSFDAILSKEYHGKVTSVARVGTSNQGVVNFTVTVELTDADELVLPQMTAAVNIVVVQLSDVTLIPNRAVRLVDGQRVIYILKNGVPTETKIELGANSDTTSELISGEVKVGDLIVLNPPTNMFAGGPPQGMRR